MLSTFCSLKVQLSLHHCRGIGALQSLRALQALRAGGMAEGATAAAHSLRQKVTVTTLDPKQIWWMRALPVSRPSS